MKRFFYSIITLIYLLVTTGIGVNVHYCMGEISAVEFHESEKKTCDKCGMEEKAGGCCSNQKQFYKYDHSSKFQDGHFFSFVNADLPKQYQISWGLPDSYTCESIKYSQTDKPDPGGPPIYLRNNVFRL